MARNPCDEALHREFVELRSIAVVHKVVDGRGEIVIHVLTTAAVAVVAV